MRLDSEPSLTVGLMHQQHNFRTLPKDLLRVMNCSFAARQYGQALPDCASPLLDLWRLSLAAMVKKVLDAGKAKPYRTKSGIAPFPNPPTQSPA